jgi:hypothetical protein
MSFVVAAIVGTGAYAANRADSAADKARAAAAEQALIQQEAENRRIAEAQAEAERVRQAEVRRQQNITAGQGEIASLFGQFDDNFYNDRAKAYLDYNQPTLDQQYQDQQRSLTSQLARTGNLNSSLRGDLMGKLQRQYDTGKLSLADNANRVANEARASVMGAKTKLMESNASLADPGLVRNMAEAQAQGLKVAPQYQSLGQMISDLSSGIQTSAAPKTTGSGAGVNLFSGGTGGSTGRVIT